MRNDLALSAPATRHVRHGHEAGGRPQTLLAHALDELRCTVDDDVPLPIHGDDVIAVVQHHGVD
jgi:hypothetical protein